MFKPPGKRVRRQERRAKGEMMSCASEYVAEFCYRPTKCCQDYRVIVVWKDLDVY